MAVQLDMEKIASGEAPSRAELVRLVVSLSTPAILAEFATVAMEYIDAAMVGSLGAEATAAIGLVASTTWLVGGLCMAATVGFSVQIAQLAGGGSYGRARNVLRQSIVVLMAFSVVLALLGVAVSGPLPVVLGGEPDVCPDASSYFFIFSIALPALMLQRVGVSALQCSGDMRTPSVLSIITCLLDVVFNFALIFPTRQVEVWGHVFTVYGADLGVTGAAVGTALAELVVGIALMWFACVRSPMLKLWGRVEPRYADDVAPTWKPQARCLKIAAKTAAPLCVERVVMNGAQVASIAIISPLGTVAVAAHSLAITAEGLCYMPGYGIASAATTLVGQSIGAGRIDLARRFARTTTFFGMAVMAAAALVIFIVAPALMGLLTPVEKVQTLGSDVLRIAMVAEPLFGASIVASGAMRGAGDTLVPSIIGTATMWGIRIVAAVPLVAAFELYGMWVAMSVELCVRGILFLMRLFRERWLSHGRLVSGS